MTIPPPVRLRRRVRLLAVTTVDLARLEASVRRRSLPRLCADAGIAFRGFERPTDLPQEEPLARRVADVWWAVERTLRWWPWARRRPCLRRSLLLGRGLSHLEPTLVLEVVRLSPLVAHAVLVVGGHRLDMGDLEPGTDVGVRTGVRTGDQRTDDPTGEHRPAAG